MPLTPEDFRFVSDLVRRRAAVVVGPGKEYLVETRLGALARRGGFGSLEALLAAARAEAEGPLSRRIVEAMTTHETAFFRDGHPFDALRDVVLPDLIRRRAAERALNLWCAAASSGQEAYSVALVLREHFPSLDGWTVRLLATDVSTAMIERAREGSFGAHEIRRGLPEALRDEWFDPEGDAGGWRAKPELRAMLRFETLNLASAWPVLPRMDVLFLRNVLIYFDVETKRMLLDRAWRVLRPDGWMFLGGAETTMALPDAFERTPVGRAVAYRPRRGVAP